MRTSRLAFWAAAALAAAHFATAQQAPRARSPEAPAAQAAVSAADLETFATIYVDLLDTVAKFEQEMKTAQTEQQELDMKGRVETESIAKVAQRGWTPEKFNQVSVAINSDPALTDRVVSSSKRNNG